MCDTMGHGSQGVDPQGLEDVLQGWFSRLLGFSRGKGEFTEARGGMRFTKEWSTVAQASSSHFVIA